MPFYGKENGMDINNYTWITGKIVPRQWGTEYRYTVKNGDDKYFDSIVLLPGGEKTPEKDIIKLIEAQLLQIDVEPEITISIEEEKESEIKAFLVTKGLLAEDQDYRYIKSKSEILAEKEVE